MSNLAHHYIYAQVIKTLHADIFDEDTWALAKLNQAKLVVSCLEDGQEAECAIGRHLATGETFYITTTEDDTEAVELYENGSDFVIHTEELATKKLKEVRER